MFRIKIGNLTFKMGIPNHGSRNLGLGICFD